MAELTAIDARDRVVGDTIALRSDGPIRERGWKYVRTTRTGRVLVQAVLPGGHVETVGYADVAPRTGQVAVVAIRVSAMQSAGTLDQEVEAEAEPPLAFSPVGPMPTPEPGPEPAPPVEQPPEPPFDPSGPGWPDSPTPPAPTPEPEPPVIGPSGPGWND